MCNKLLITTICFILISMPLFLFSVSSVSAEQFSEQKQLIQSYYDALLKYFDECNSPEYLKMHPEASDPSDPFGPILTDPQKKHFDSIFVDEEPYMKIINSLNPWISAMHDGFIYSIENAKILNIEKYDSDIHWKVILNTRHILYRKYKDVSDAISDAFKNYSVVNISEEDYKNVLQQWERSIKTYCIFNTVEEHYFLLEKADNSYKIKSIKRNVISYEYDDE